MHDDSNLVRTFYLPYYAIYRDKLRNMDENWADTQHFFLLLGNKSVSFIQDKKSAIKQINGFLL